jgi:hypothetical protein
MEHEHGGFKVNCEWGIAAVKNSPETAIFGLDGDSRALQRNKIPMPEI